MFDLIYEIIRNIVTGAISSGVTFNVVEMRRMCKLCSQTVLQRITEHMCGQQLRNKLYYSV
jgi:hypothetical protein